MELAKPSPLQSEQLMSIINHSIKWSIHHPPGKNRLLENIPHYNSYLALLQYIWQQWSLCLTEPHVQYNAEYLYIYLCLSALLPVTYQYINTISDACLYYMHQTHHITHGNRVKSAQSSK